MKRRQSVTSTSVSPTRKVRVAETGSPILCSTYASTPQLQPSQRFTGHFISPQSPSRHVKVEHPEPVTKTEPLVKTAPVAKPQRPSIDVRSVIDRRIALIHTLTKVRIAASKCVEDATTAHRLMANFVTVALATERNVEGAVEAQRIAAGCMEIIRACHAIAVVLGEGIASLQEGDDGMLEQVGTASQTVLMHCRAALIHAQEAQVMLKDISAFVGERKVEVMERRMWDVRERFLGIVGWIGH